MLMKEEFKRMAWLRRVAAYTEQKQKQVTTMDSKLTQQELLEIWNFATKETERASKKAAQTLDADRMVNARAKLYAKLWAEIRDKIAEMYTNYSDD